MATLTTPLDLLLGRAADPAAFERWLDVGRSTGWCEHPVRLAGSTLHVDPATGETAVPGVFAGGEIATGPGAMIDAVANGKRVAEAVDRFLGGDGVVETDWAERAPTAGYDGRRPKGFADRTRAHAATLPVGERHDGFPEVELPLDEAAARAEADRCFHCDLEKHPERLIRTKLTES